MIHYCTYSDFLSGDIPTSTLLLVDEVDSLFFSDKAEIRGNRFVSSVLFLNKYKVLAMTATFRGAQGQNKLSQLLKDSLVIKTATVVADRVLNLDVFGKLGEE